MIASTMELLLLLLRLLLLSLPLPLLLLIINTYCCCYYYYQARHPDLAPHQLRADPDRERRARRDPAGGLAPVYY